MENCEPWQGNCPCNFPNDKCPGTSSPGWSAGYVWLPFAWSKLKLDPEYLICARETWRMRLPPGANDTCYTFNVFPEAKITPGLDPATLVDYRGKSVPYVESSCGFVSCPGWPMTKEENSGNTTRCCERVGDAITQGRNAGRCRAADLCLGQCREDENGNIPGGHGGCAFASFDPAKAKLLNGATDCTNARASGLSLTGGGPDVVDPCRGAHMVPKP